MVATGCPAQRYRGQVSKTDGHLRKGEGAVKELIEYIAKFIADSPDEVKVTEVEEEDRIVIRLEVAPDDKGKVIGREGRVAQAMRTLLRVGAVKRGVRAVLEIV